MKKNAILAAIAGAAMLGLTACGGASDASTPSATPSASATPSLTPSPSKATSTPKQLASAIYTTRQGFLKAAKDFDANRCDDVLTSGMKGLDAATCTADLIVLKTSAETIVIVMDSNKPWPDELSTLADSTYRYTKQVAGVADTKDYSSSSIGIVKLSVKLAALELESWAPYIGS